MSAVLAWFPSGSRFIYGRQVPSSYKDHIDDGRIESGTFLRLILSEYFKFTRVDNLLIFFNVAQRGVPGGEIRGLLEGRRN
jgi:hypothetical protein